MDEHINALVTIVQSALVEVLELVRFVTNLPHGVINPNIVTPNQLIGYLATALLHLQRGRSLPTPVIRTEVRDLLKIMELKALGRRDAVVVVEEIPLVGRKKHCIAKAYPLPTYSISRTS